MIIEKALVFFGEKFFSKIQAGAKDIHEQFQTTFHILHVFLLELAAGLASSYVTEGCRFRFTGK